MAKIHEIGIGADTRAFEDNIKRGVIRPTEEAEKALQELGDTDAGRDAARDLERVEDALKRDVIEPAKDAERALKDVGDTDAGTDAARDLDKLEDALKDAQRQSEKLSDSMDDFDVRGRSGFGKVGEAAQEVTQEVGQNLGEAVSSVRGNLSDLGQVGQDTLGGLAATLAGTGPAGIAGAAALAAGAVGLGLVTAELEEQQKQTERLKEYFSEAWKAAVEGGRDYIDQATIIGEMNDIIFNPDRAEEYKRIQEDVNTLSLDRGTLLRAAAGDQDALNLVIQRSGELYQEAGDKADKAYEKAATVDDKAFKAAVDHRNAIDAVNDRWRQYGDVSSENQRKAQDAAKVTSDYLLNAISEAGDATQAVDDFGNKLISLPDGRQVVIDAETGQATTDLSRFKTDTDGVINHVNGREAVIKTRTEVDRRAYDAFLQEMRNTTIKIKGRVVTTPDGGRYLP